MTNKTFIYKTICDIERVCECPYCQSKKADELFGYTDHFPRFDTAAMTRTSIMLCSECKKTYRIDYRSEGNEYQIMGFEICK